MNKDDTQVMPEQELIEEILPAQEVTEENEALPNFDELLEEVIANDPGYAGPEDVPDEDELRATAVLDEELVQQVLSSPAFEDMDGIGQAEDPMIYRNFSNGYGKDVKKLNAFTKMSKEDRARTVLMFIVSGLCLGVIGLMIYWLVRFF